MSGQLLRIGIIDNNLKSTLPKGGAYILKIEGFQAIKMIINE